MPTQACWSVLVAAGANMSGIRFGECPANVCAVGRTGGSVVVCRTDGSSDRADECMIVYDCVHAIIRMIV
jgi:hypothetical protein